MSLIRLCSVTAVSTLLLAGPTATAYAGSRDSDHDGIPNRFERSHGLNPHRAPTPPPTPTTTG